jgi:hypothetical protein|tara:strand:+ start:63 stop:281 length:219 start_codon:yes stop_codon:yes gene_type:complete
MINFVFEKDKKKMNSLKQLSFRCKEDTWKRFKMFCTFHEVHVQDKIGQLIEEYLEKKGKVDAGTTANSKGNI